MGFKVCDFKETFVLKQDLWHEYLVEKPSPERKRQIIKEAYADFDVFLDQPHFIMYDEVVAVYPDTKAVYWHRPADSWYPSFLKTFLEAESIFPEQEQYEKLRETDIVSFKMFEALFHSHFKGDYRENRPPCEKNKKYIRVS